MSDAATEWADALESGEYQQRTRFLYDGTCHCALGVAAQVLLVDKGKGALAE